MKKLFFNITLSLFVFTIMTTNYSIKANAYTQDDCIAAWNEWAEEHDVDINEWKSTGGG